MYIRRVLYLKYIIMYILSSTHFHWYKKYADFVLTTISFILSYKKNGESIMIFFLSVRKPSL